MKYRFVHRFGCTAFLTLILTSGSLIAQDEIPFGTLERLNEQNVLLDLTLTKNNLTPDSFVAELKGESLDKAVEIMARAAASDDPRPDGSDDPRPDGSDDPRPDAMELGSDDPRPDGMDPATGTPKVIVVESSIGKNSAYLRGFRNANLEGQIVRIPFVRTFKKIDGVWKISSWLESKL